MKKIIFVLVLFSFLYTISFAQNDNWDNINSGGKKITALAEYENYIWVGTDIGLIKLNKTDGSIDIFDKTSGLPGNYITAIAIDNNGNIWFGLSSSEYGISYGLVKYDGANFNLYNTSNSDLPSNNITALCIDEEGILWIGCSQILSYSCIVKYDGVDWITYDANNSLLPAGAVIKSIATDSTKLWVGTHGGLVSFDGTIWELYSGVPSIIINSVFVDNNNNKWVGLFNGVVKYNDSTWTVFSGSENNEDVCIIKRDGSNFINLTNDGYSNTSPRWSYDGKEIIFVSNRTGNKQIYSIDIITKVIKQLTFSNGDNYSPTW